MRSKPDPVDQPERTAHYDCALLKCYTILAYSTETVLLIFPLLQTNITVRIRSSGGWGGSAFYSDHILISLSCNNINNKSTLLIHLSTYGRRTFAVTGPMVLNTLQDDL